MDGGGRRWREPRDAVAVEAERKRKPRLPGIATGYVLTRRMRPGSSDDMEPPGGAGAVEEGAGAVRARALAGGRPDSA